ncbi:uncharacterized protein LOC128249668 [Octopus bimaculoides]|uniref:uncharacterized protein LOC128249668 n=1 Tax=Octopus bimaculoides TaxID=37653 RepID=UPI0022E868E8|nr:uncharacterized protein LOC128249668 [Octopus bimaculoides]
MGNIEELVLSKINNKKVVIFSKSYCPFCSKAKQAFRDHIGSIISPDDYEVMELEDHPDAEKILDYLLDFTGSRTFGHLHIFVDMRTYIYRYIILDMIPGTTKHPDVNPNINYRRRGK